MVKFDTWTAFRAGAMTYRISAHQWILTTGLPIESNVMVRDHIGNCFNLSTLTTLEWEFLPVTPDEPEITLDMVQEQCIMPSCERWHCVLTPKETTTSTGMHLYQQDIQRSLLQKGRLLWPKIWQVAILPPIHESEKRSSESQEPRGWKLVTLEDVRMTVQGHHVEKEKVRVIMFQKERVLARKERSLARPSELLKEKSSRELVESPFLDQQHLLKLERKET